MNNGKMFKAWSAGIVLMTVSAFAGATPLTMDLKYSGFPDGSRGGTIIDDGTGTNVRAGMFRFSVSNVQGTSPIQISSGDVLDAFCVDIHTYLDTTNVVGYSLLSATSYFSDVDKVDQIGKLYTGFESSVRDSGNAGYSAAFQLALWEIINEKTSELSLTGGSFASHAFVDARGIAGEWLGSLDNFQNNYDLFVLSSDLTGVDDVTKKSQDLLVFSPKSPAKVTEPGTLALLALGIGGLVLRRKAGRAKS
jgi:hypothetical protein